MDVHVRNRLTGDLSAVDADIVTVRVILFVKQFLGFVNKIEYKKGSSFVRSKNV